MKRMTLILIAALGMAFGGPSSSQDESALGTLNVHCPHWGGFTDSDQSGLYVESIRAIFEPVGIEVEFTFTPYEASISNVQDKTADMALSAYLNEFPGVLYPRWPQEREQPVVAHKSTTPYAGSGSLVGKRSAWVRSYDYQRFLPKGLEYVEVRTEVLGMRQLDRDRVDYFIDYKPTILKAAAEGGVDMAGIELSPIAELEKLVFVMIRDDERGREILDLYDRRMAELHQDGSLDRIFQKYGYDGYGASPRAD